MQVRDERPALEALGATAVAVGFSPVEPLAALAEHLDWPWPFLSDPDRLLYRRLGFGRASTRQVWTGGTLAVYRRSLARGVRPRKPVEDSHQLGGDAIVGNGRVLRVFRTASPDDRTPIGIILAALGGIDRR
ncbi:hypothetical protein BH20ACT2_BH20ACT2_01510 [soil metagenome]